MGRDDAQQQRQQEQQPLRSAAGDDAVAAVAADGASAVPPGVCSHIVQGDAAPPTFSRPEPPPPPPPANGDCLLHVLPRSLQVTICSYLSYEWRQLERYGWLCRSFRENLDEEMVWRHLCADYWFVQEEHFERWPQISSWRALYRTLEQWAVFEGFYTLPSAFPWCLLVILRFDSGSLIADAVRFCCNVAAEGDPDAPAHQALELYVRLFEITFSEEADGNVRASLAFAGDTKGIFAGVAAHVEPMPDSVASALPQARQIGFEESVMPGFINAARGFAVALERPEESADGELWQPDAWSQRHHSPARLTEITPYMVYHLMRAGRTLPLAMVRSPFEYTVDDPLVELLRPGLYVGNYCHDFYGQFKHEVLLVEFRECGLDGLRSLFARPGDRDRGGNTWGRVPQELRQAWERSDSASATFLVGVKVTGDYHVPAGQTTFVALVTPHDTKRLIDQERGDLQEVRNRSTGRAERVVHA